MSRQNLAMFQQSIIMNTFCPAQRRRYERTVRERHNLLACDKIETPIREMTDTIKVDFKIRDIVNLDIVVENDVIKINFHVQEFGKDIHLDINVVPYVPEPSKYVFKVAGSSANINIYDVSLLSNNTFTCNCPDFTNEERPHGCNCVVSHCWCKHVCFIASKVGKIYDVQAYTNKVITNEHRASLIACIPSIWKDRKVVNYDYLNAFKAFMTERDNGNTEAADEFDAKNARNLDDDCGICFCPLVDDKGTELKACPQCLNAVHTKCIIPWLNMQNKCCANCRSPSWARFEYKYEHKYDSLETRVANIRAMRRLRRHAAE
jgi:hypothetical protein